jgi:Fe2+ or Zn2+ uptake regulation protein
MAGEKAGFGVMMTGMESIFPTPGHDHGRCTADALRHAESQCDRCGKKLTPTRRQVLEVLLQSHKPLGAYEIIDRTARDGARHAPITIYRALDFLIENGLVHRIESRNAYIGCVHRHGGSALGCGGAGAAAGDARGGFRAEGAGDRDRRHLRQLPLTLPVGATVLRGGHATHSAPPLSAGANVR